MKAKMKADVKARQEMKERRETEGKAYMKKMFAKWRAYREGIVTRQEAIHEKIDNKLRADWAKLDTDQEERRLKENPRR
jgi:hypothetical protein